MLLRESMALFFVNNYNAIINYVYCKSLTIASCFYSMQWDRPESLVEIDQQNYIKIIYVNK